MTDNNRLREGTQAITRAVVILKEIAKQNRSGARLTDIASATELELPTARRILKGLIRENLVAQHALDRRYFLGNLAYEIGLAAVPGIALRELCQPSLERLARDTGNAVFLKVRSGLDAVCVDRREGSFPVRRLTVDIGTRSPLGVGSGAIALLSSLPAEEMGRVLRTNALRYAPHGVSLLSVRRKVQACKRNGYATHPALRIPGVRGVAVPIRNPDGISIASLSIAATEARMKGPHLGPLVELLRSEARQIALELARNTTGGNYVT